MADWTFEQARADLNVSEAHLRALVRRRLVPHYRVGDLVRFQSQVLEAWKARGGTAAPPLADGAPSRASLRRAPSSVGDGEQRSLAAAVLGSSSAWRSRVGPGLATEGS